MMNLNHPAIRGGKLDESDFEPYVLPHMAVQWGEHQPQPAEAATEMSADYPPVSRWLIVLIYLASAAISTGIVWMAVSAVQP